MQLPQQFGPYTLHELIARGGMAEVYRATMGGVGAFEKTVAIKKILPHLAADEDFVSMLIDEARIIVSINHSNIAQVLDLGQIEDTYYIAMEFIQGVDLADILKDVEAIDSKIPIEHCLWICRCVLSGLHHAHNASDASGRPLNVVHRDVSPHNVLVSFGGDVKLIDFGVAKARGMDTTKSGVIKGKLLYMAPEQAMAKEVDSRADIFSAGVVLYRMLTANLPFEGDNEFQIYNNIMSREIVPPREINPSVTEEINQIAMMLLHRDPSKRYQDGYSAVVDLDRALQNVSPGYSVSRFGRYLEENFSHLLRRRVIDSGMHFSPPQTPPPSVTQTQDNPQLIPMKFNKADESPTFDDSFDLEKVPVREPANANPPEPMNAPNGPDQSWRTQNPALAQTGPITSKPQQIDTGKKKSALVPIAATLMFWLISGGLLAYEFTVKRPAEEAVMVVDEIPEEEFPEEAPLPKEINIEIKSTPKAVLFLNGEELGETPFVGTLDSGREPIEVKLEAEGYAPESFEFIPDKDIQKTVELLEDEEGGSDVPEEDEEADAKKPAEDPPKKTATKKKKPRKKKKKSTKKSTKKKSNVMILGDDPKPTKKKKKKSEDDGKLDIFDL